MADEAPAAAGTETISDSPSALGDAAPAAPSPKPERTSAVDDVRAAFAELEAKSPEAGKEVVKSPEGSKDEGQPRGPDGKFAPKVAASPEPVVDASKAPERPKIEPPPNWKGAAKVDWNKLPYEVKQELAQDYKTRADLESKWSPINEVLSPREQALTAQYGGVAPALKQLLALSDFATSQPLQFLQYFAQQRGINLNSLAPKPQEGGPSSDQEQVSPIVAQLQQQVQGLTQHLTQERQSQAAAVQQQAQSEVEAILKDSEKYPYAQDVRHDMGILFQTGRAKNLDEAYQTAVYMNPTVRQRIIEAQKAEALKTAEQRATEKRSAAVSITGAPGGRQAPQETPRKETARETVRRLAESGGYFGSGARL